MGELTATLAEALPVDLAGSLVAELVAEAKRVVFVTDAPCIDGIDLLVEQCIYQGTNARGIVGIVPGGDDQAPRSARKYA